MARLVLLAESGGVGTLVLNRPEKLNAFGDDMRQQLTESIDAAAAHGGIRALVLTGSGRAFSAGGDVHFMAALKQRGASFDEMRPLVEGGRAAILKLAALPFPTLAAVNGPAAGGGLNLALACDLRIASDQATFGETFARIGLHPDWGGTYFLPRLVGLARALELCWTGDMIDAAEALRIGLVNRVVPAAGLAQAAQALAARLAAAPQASVRLAKRNLGAAFHRTLAACLDAETEAMAACWSSPDAAEGIRAFVEKRAPAFDPNALPPDEAPAGVAQRFE